MMGGVTLAGFFIFVAVYLTPSLIALKMKHRRRYFIVLINIFGGVVFGVGWLIALIMCFFDNDSGKKDFDDAKN